MKKTHTSEMPANEMGSYLVAPGYMRTTKITFYNMTFEN